MTKLTPETAARIIARVELGVSYADAAAADVKLPTAKTWLSRGRREDSGRYADFASAVEPAREVAQTQPGPADEYELACKVSELARAGSVQAARLRWQMIVAERRRDKLRANARGPLAELDELAKRRQRRQGRDR